MLAAALAAGVVRGVEQPDGTPPASVVVEAAEERPLERLREVTGELRASKRAALAVEEAGLVVRLEVNEGERVEEGQLLVALDDKRAQIAVLRARAERDAIEALIDQRLAELDLARSDAERWARAREQRSATPAELDQSQTQVRSGEALLAQARADLAAAEADLALAERRLEDMTVEAPFAGRVISRHVEAGEWLNQGDPVVEVMALDPVEVWVDVPERYIGRFADRSGSVRVRIEPLGEERVAESGTIIPAADPLSRLFPVRAILKNQDGRLKPGMTITGLIPTGRVEPMLTVHKDAILRDEAGAFVFYDADGVAAVSRVRPLFAVGEYMAIERGTLKPGARVIVEGNERLFPGRPLKASPRGGAAPGPGGAQ